MAKVASRDDCGKIRLPGEGNSAGEHLYHTRGPRHWKGRCVQRVVGYVLFGFFLLVGLIFRVLLIVGYIAIIVTAAIEGGVLAAVAAFFFGAIGVAILRLLYGVVAFPVVALVSWLLEEQTAGQGQPSTFTVVAGPVRFSGRLPNGEDFIARSVATDRATWTEVWDSRAEHWLPVDAKDIPPLESGDPLVGDAREIADGGLGEY